MQDERVNDVQMRRKRFASRMCGIAEIAINKSCTGIFFQTICNKVAILPIYFLTTTYRC
jgi:hypothetical protein